MNAELLDSDSSDEDYVPDKKVEDTSSELESDEDSKQRTLLNEEPCSVSKKRRKNSSKSKKKLKNTDCSEPTNLQSNIIAEEEKKQKEDDVWADFMKDTGFKSKKEISEGLNNHSMKSLPSNNRNECKKTTAEENKPKKITITEIFDFAGEKVVVEKELKRPSELVGVKQVSTSKNRVGEPKSGVGGILSQLGKKTKISTLEKTKLDWDRFKREENLEEELQTFNRGKDGYLEKQDFLNRADLRRFEIEKELRTIERSKRVNNAP